MNSGLCGLISLRLCQGSKVKAVPVSRLNCGQLFILETDTVPGDSLVYCIGGLPGFEFHRHSPRRGIADTIDVIRLNSVPHKSIETPVAPLIVSESRNQIRFSSQLCQMGRKIEGSPAYMLSIADYIPENFNRRR